MLRTSRDYKPVVVHWPHCNSHVVGVHAIDAKWIFLSSKPGWLPTLPRLYNIGFSKKLGLRSYRSSTFKSVQLYTNGDDIMSTDISSTIDNCLSFNVDLSAFNIIGSLYLCVVFRRSLTQVLFSIIQHFFLFHVDFQCLPKTKMHKDISLSTLNTCWSTRKPK